MDVQSSPFTLSLLLHRHSESHLIDRTINAKHGQLHIHLQSRRARDGGQINKRRPADQAIIPDVDGVPVADSRSAGGGADHRATLPLSPSPSARLTNLEWKREKSRSAARRFVGRWTDARCAMVMRIRRAGSFTMKSASTI